MDRPHEVICSRIWEEVAEPDNPFAAAACYCSGYDVHGELLGRASWAEYLYLLFKLERPTAPQAKLLEALAVALANPGPRDHSVHAAMCGGAGGSPAAASLIAALAVGAGNLGGAREVFVAMRCWESYGEDLDAWLARLAQPPSEDRPDCWLDMEHAPGFDPNGVSCATTVRQTLAYLGQCSPSTHLAWLAAQRNALEQAAGCPLAMSGVAAAALADLGFTAEQGEMLYLLLRLPGAAAHALEQREQGWRRFPFFGKGLLLVDDPGPVRKE
jgi:citrate synthase